MRASLRVIMYMSQYYLHSNEHYGIHNERLNNELEKNKYLAQSEQTFTKCKENKSHDISYAAKKGSASSPSNS